MADLPRLNQVIKAFESGQPAFTTFSPADIEPAVALAQSKFDGVVYEMEHNFWDARMLRDALQYMLNRRQIVQGGTLEASNVQVSDRLAELTSVSRGFEALQRAISLLMNDVDGRAIEHLGRR